MTALRRWLLSAVLLLTAAAMAAAQTTGTIVGRVTDEGGGTLPGVTVEARSPALQGTSTAVTDGSGAYRLNLLPPGDYTVSFVLDGFAKESRQEVHVGLDQNTTLSTTLRAALTQEITVTGDVPVIDTTSTTVGVNLDTRAIETLPTGRNYSSVVQITPGVSSDANAEATPQPSITVYGSTGSENSYLIDGVNTTGAEYGAQGTELNFEFIQAVDVKTGGYQAEYGRSTGGVVNVITKSGGNDFHGDLFGYHDNDSLQSNAKPVVSTGGTAAGYTREDYGIDVGGFLLRDKLWFFGAYDRVDNTDKTTLPGGPLAGNVVQPKSKRDLAAAKLTWKLSDSQSLVST
ncbi:MAG TPA: TonB-dependent receptor, partial [Thermoanaerobaculia bacterium]